MTCPRSHSWGGHPGSKGHISYCCSPCPPATRGVMRGGVLLCSMCFRRSTLRLRAGFLDLGAADWAQMILAMGPSLLLEDIEQHL